MTTKTLSNEKKWLLHNLAQSKAEQQHFIDLAKPLLDRFISSNLTEDHYGGYAVELRMFKPQSAKYENEYSLISLSKKLIQTDGRLLLHYYRMMIAML